MSLQTPDSIRRLQRKLYLKAKAEPDFRFYLLYEQDLSGRHPAPRLRPGARECGRAGGGRDELRDDRSGGAGGVAFDFVILSRGHAADAVIDLAA
jgi:hypothetical protein